jgi:serine/threonine protein kinase
LVEEELEDDKENNYGLIDDAYRLGKLIYYLLTGLDLHTLSDKEKFSIPEFNDPSIVPSGAKDLVMRMLVPDPKKRLTVG